MDISMHNIQNILRRMDIEGFIAEGAPGAEYNDEAQAIALALTQSDIPVPETDQVALFLREIWRKSFHLDEQGLSQRQTAFRQAAAQISALA